jgi:2-keto-4-pentenoate hydratase/2-oxohepta-3-ene-1,7-dioic acid hydratase in catechol pathway
MEIDNQWWSLEDHAQELGGASGATGLLQLLGHWEENKARLTALAKRLVDSPAGKIEAPTGEQLLAPVQLPNKLFCIGFNFYDHIEKDAKMTDFKKDEKDPFFFLKPPSTTLVGSGKTVPFPTGTEKLDWEVELVAVIGRGGRNIPRSRALEHVAGYMVGIDLSARDWQLNARHPIKFDIFTGKSFDASAPTGPFFVPADALNHHDLRMKLWVNDKLWQDSNSKEMIWTLEEQIETLSKSISLEPGDLVFTGTPAGVGFPSGTFLKPGDKVSAEIDGLGRLDIEITPPIAV